MKKKVTQIILFSAVFVLFTACSNQQKSTSEKMDAIEVILTRTSVRTYLDKKVEPEKIDVLLKAAMAAPSAVNKQPWAFIVITDRDKLNTLAESLPHAKMLTKAPLAIVVCGDLSKGLEGNALNYWVQDVSAASENLLLAAHALGLGAVWTGVYPLMERVNDVSRILELPRHIVPLNVIPVGYPAGETAPKDKWNPENIHYNGWGK